MASRKAKRVIQQQEEDYIVIPNSSIEVVPLQHRYQSRSSQGRPSYLTSPMGPHLHELKLNDIHNCFK